ncbi:MAG TPA: signal peptidase I [Pirellulales bacterium]|jgi:signal peptidase I|nr:signal peptidase I [Pirellulales bacterium]
MNPPKHKTGSAGRPVAGRAEVSGIPQTPGWSRTLRETIESIAIAFMLAFLFRTFEAEAFVIPTGSMAPTLMGKHLDIACPKCGFEYRVGAPHDDEEDPSRAVPAARDADLANTCVCPNCGYTLDFAHMNPSERASYVYYNGDRILVSKFVYDFSPPARWDVIVFKYPEDAKTNYIKRLVGLPNDLVRIRDGDIAVSHDNGKTFVYQPRSPGKLRSMLQMVFDDDHAFRPFVEKGWPAALQGEGRDAAAWTAVASNSKERYGPTAFITAGKLPSGAPAEAWLRYYHYVPNEQDWSRFQHGQKLSFIAPSGEQYPQPQPITDSNPYDTPFRDQLGNPSPVDDLAIEFQVDVQQTQGKLALELIKQGQPFRCLLDLAAGSAEMEIPGWNQKTPPRAATGGISRTGSHQILFANVDHQITLLVDDKKVEFDPPAVWSDVAPGNASVGSPAAIGSMGAPLQINHFRILRDIFYTYDTGRFRDDQAPQGWPTDVHPWSCFPPEGIDKLRQAGADVREYDQYFFLGDNQFFTLGDNTRLSQDGRFWSPLHFVDRRLLIGKALVIYWPHSFDRVSIFGHEVPFPYWPNFSRMGFVR